MFLVIEHSYGEIFGDPFIVFNEIDLKSFLFGDYLIYDLYDYVLSNPDKSIGVLKVYKKVT